MHAKGRIVFTFHFVSKAHFSAYNNVSSAVSISRPGVSTPQYSYLGLCIDIIGELLSCHNFVIPAAYLYAEGCIVSTCLFVSEAYIRVYNNVSTAVLIHRAPGVLPPQQCSNLVLCIASVGELYNGLQNCLRSRYPIRVCNIVIPAAYLYAEGCIVFTCLFVSEAYNLFVSEAYIRAYNIVFSALLILSPPRVLPPQQCSFLGVCIDSIRELLPGLAELSSQQIS